MAREKGMGSLQQEKSGRWTLRVAINGNRFSRSTGTRDRDAAERFAQRFLSPFGLGTKRLPLSEVWFEYERSPNRRDLAPSTIISKRQVWMQFARWMEHEHLEVSELRQLTGDMVGEYLRSLRAEHSATTYNNHVCVLREICRTLYEKAGMAEDPWEGVRLLSNDAHSRREFSLDELERVLKAARRASATDEWEHLFLIGIYTGLRLGDCCTLTWSNVHFEREIIQLVPRKTRKHAHGIPITIPIHPVLMAALKAECAKNKQNSCEFVLPRMAEWYRKTKWRIGDGLKRIFKSAGIVTSVRIEGRRYKAPEATFHSLRHTFVSLAANAGIPLPVVQSIVGHTTTAMTRHYYHEKESDLWRAVNAIPNLSATCHEREESAARVPNNDIAERHALPIRDRLEALKALLADQTISQDEYKTARLKILAEV